MELWRQIQRQNFNSWNKLFHFLELDPTYELEILKTPRFPLNLPLRLAQKIRKNYFDDPILKQFLPLQRELDSTTGFTNDAVGDIPARKAGKLLHKYQGRALLLCTSSCVMNCRFCFRQKFDYETEIKNFDAEMVHISEDSTLSEIILSGGDPLSLSNRTLAELIGKLDQIPHLKRLRFHTRFPLGIPERIDEGFLSLLKQTRLQIFFVVHINHPQELDSDIIGALKEIQKLGIPILSQTVLLRGVNDQASILKELFETLANRGILPYYLHQHDRVIGTAHFEVPEAEGKMLLAEVSRSLSGYAVPKYVKEEAGRPSKTPLQ